MPELRDGAVLKFTVDQWLMPIVMSKMSKGMSNERKVDH